MKPWMSLLPLWSTSLRKALLLTALLGLSSGWALAGPARDRLTLLVPDGADPKSWQVQVWADSAADEGVTLELISDSALLALGNTAAAKIAGLIVPDSAHIRASDAVVAAILWLRRATVPPTAPHQAALVAA